MKYYRIVFAKNEVISCSEAPEIIDEHVERKNGQLIFALVQARSDQEATELGKNMAAQMVQTRSADYE